jgi:hypothetical protein
VLEKASAIRGSHDHILLVQELTGGFVFVAESKRPRIKDLRLYDGNLMGGGQKPKCFMNCVFPAGLLGADRRLASESTKPGFRHDLLLDFEKRRNDVSGHMIKDESIADQEKEDFIAVLARLPFIAWAAKTPHGVHAGVYFRNWMECERSFAVAKWIDAEVATTGYFGLLKIDLGTSVNRNRPSRFIDEFSFWRPEARFNLTDVFGTSKTGN